MNDQIIKKTKQIIECIGTEEKDILKILNEIHSCYNYLPEESLRTIISSTKISPSRLSAVMTFFSDYRLKPAGKYTIKVCTGTACHVKGAENLYREFQSTLNIEEDDDTDSERLFTVKKVACLGCCMIAPAVQIDDITYGYVTKSIVPNLLKDFISSQNLKLSDKITTKKVYANNLLKICLCSSCKASGAEDILNFAERLINKFSFDIKIKSVACHGASFRAPILEIQMENGRKYKYGQVSETILKKILFTHFKPKKMTDTLINKLLSLVEKVYDTQADDQQIIRYLLDNDSEFKKYNDNQKIISTMHGGDISPLDITEYEKTGGFSAFHKIRDSKNYQSVIDKIASVKLRGRGGGGFPTSNKWQIVFENSSLEKYLICNADEGDPGAFMDRILIESFPYRVLEGILIASVVCGITDIYIFIRSEYTLAIKRLEEAINNCRIKGYFDFTKNKTLHLVTSAGSFVCGEETSLLNAIEGKRPFARIRPPYPSDKGLWSKPTIVNNVETFSLIPWILNNQTDDFRKFGTENSPGTKTFALAGKIKNGGLIEIPMGETLKNIVYNIGGGLTDGKKLKAVQIGGPAGACVPADLIDHSVDFESLQEIGAIMGSGGMVVLNEDDCIVDMVKYFIKFSVTESCGRCNSCRNGTMIIFEILNKITHGKGLKKDLFILKELSDFVKEMSLCGLGKAAPNPLLSSLKYFHKEFDEHINGFCSSGVCKELFSLQISDECRGCTKCKLLCPVEAIEGEPYLKHWIDFNKCIKCKACKDICDFNAVEITRIDDK